MNKLIEDTITEIISLCEKHSVVSIALFGSAAKETMGKDSDVDFLVQFSEEIDVLDYADNYFSLLGDLEKLLSYPLNIYPPFEGTKADKRDKKIETIFKP